jgi:hypothetical protein
MATLKIKNSSFLSSQFLKIDSTGVSYSDGVIFSNARKFIFKDIDCILLSRDNVLSFQVKKEVFSIPVKPENKKHKLAIDTLVQEVQRTLVQNS